MKLAFILFFALLGLVCPVEAHDFNNDHRRGAYLQIPKDIAMEEPVYSTSERTFSVQQLLEEIEPTLIGGVIAEPGAFPMSPWVGNCTGAVVGERVLFTAAHCVSNGGTKNFTINGVSYSSKCTHHSEYRGNSTADFAVCLVNKVVEGGNYEMVTVAIDYQVGSVILLTGYGCQVWGGGLDGKYRIGKAPATRVPGSSTNYDTVTRGSSALCSGDSGGPAFLVAEDGSRKVIGVNSRSDTKVTSYLSSHGVQTAQNFYKNWAQQNGVKICGIHSDAQGCRSQMGPKEPVKFVVENDGARFDVTWNPNSRYSAQQAMEAVQNRAKLLEAK